VSLTALTATSPVIVTRRHLSRAYAPSSVYVSVVTTLAWRRSSSKRRKAHRKTTSRTTTACGSSIFEISSRQWDVPSQIPRCSIANRILFGGARLGYAHVENSITLLNERF